jgi:hypothetical protein
MITKEQKRLLLEHMTELLELPDLAYQKAKKRYDDMGKWFGRDESLCKNHDPHILPQGSFRLGTAIRPLDDKEEYDLDLVCKLEEGITKATHTQEALKNLVGSEIETYREARGIKSQLEEKHRCWRLEYQDDLSFHLDIVPCIPADEIRRQLILESMKKSGEGQFISDSASQLTLSITDDRHHGFKKICGDWHISNPEGYAKWFESRMNQIQQVVLKKAQVDDVPLFKRKTPLQRSVQLLKRHRDHMFKGYDDIKPISIIFTTLAARAYAGEPDVESSIRTILSQMGSFVNSRFPRIPNPVDPDEDFADKWPTQDGKTLQLEQNFWNWLKQAQVDFDLIGSSNDMDFVTKQVKQKFSVRVNSAELMKQLGLVAGFISVSTPKAHSINRSSSPKPWTR